MQRYVPTIVIDQNTLFREGLTRILAGTRYRVVHRCSGLDDIPKKPAINGHESLLLIGIGEDSPALASQLSSFKQQCALAHVILLGDHCELEDLLTAIEAGADGYLIKQISSDALLKSIDLVFMGETILPRGILQLIRDRNGEELYGPSPGNASETSLDSETPEYDGNGPGADDYQRLSNRERLILHCLTKGTSNKTIARELGIAEATVKVHIKAILRKIRVRNRTQAAVWATNQVALRNGSQET